MIKKISVFFLSSVCTFYLQANVNKPYEEMLARRKAVLAGPQMPTHAPTQLKPEDPLDPLYTNLDNINREMDTLSQALDRFNT